MIMAVKHESFSPQPCFFWFERPGCDSLNGGTRGRCSCLFSSSAPALARQLHCNCLYVTQELQVTSDSRRHLLSLVIVTSLHKANKNTRCTSTITCCGLPRGKGVGSMAQLMQECSVLLHAALCLLGDLGHAKCFRQYLSQFSSLMCVHPTLSEIN